jgi:hypothetical protein
LVGPDHIWNKSCDRIATKTKARDEPLNPNWDKNQHKTTTEENNDNKPQLRFETKPVPNHN